MTLWNEIRRGIRAYKFYGAIIIGLAVYYFSIAHVWGSIKSGRFDWVSYHNWIFMEFNGYRVLLPLVASFPYCAAIAEDWEHKSLYAIVSRTSFNRYCNAKFFSAGALGGMALALVLTISLSVMDYYTYAFDENSYYERFVASFLENGKIVQYFLYFASLQFILGMLCAGIGSIAAVMTRNRGLIYFLPVIVLAGLEIIVNFGVVGLSAGQSLIVFRSKNQEAGAVWCLIAGYLGAGVLITYIIYRKALRKRVYEW